MRKHGDADRLPQDPVTAFNVEVIVLLKYFSTFCRSLDLPLITCEVELDLLWTKDCVLVKHKLT